MKHLKTFYLFVVFDDWFGKHSENVDVIAYDFLDAIRKYQTIMPYGAQLRYARERM